MNVDIRLFRRSTLLSLHGDDEKWKQIINDLEVIEPQADADGRFQLIPAGAGIPLMLPSCSFFNRSVDEPWFIFTPGIADDGAVYIGQSDFHGLAQTAGYIPAAQIERLDEENMRLKHELTLATGLINDLRNAIASLVGTGPIVQAAESKPTVAEAPDRTRPVAKSNASRASLDTLDELELGD